MNRKLLERIVREETRKKLKEGLGVDLEQKVMEVLMSTDYGARMGPDRLARTAKDLALIMKDDPAFQKRFFRLEKEPVNRNDHWSFGDPSDS